MPRPRLSRGITAAAATTAVLALAACGSSGSSSAGATGNASGTAAPNAARARGGAAGELVQVTPTSLILNTQAGDVTVAYTSTTPVTRTSTGTVADIVAGVCVVATGTKDPGGAIIATTVQVRPVSNGKCTGAGRLGGNGGGPSATPGGATGTPDAGSGGRPTPAANFGAAAGLVSAAAGTSVTLTTLQGGSVTLTVPTTVRVVRSAPAATADLQVGDCILAQGQKDGGGTVNARSLTIVPAGPSGCFTGKGSGGFGGGGGFGGAQGGGPPGA